MKHPVNVGMQCINVLKLDHIMGKHLMALHGCQGSVVFKPCRAQYCWCQVSVGVQRYETALISYAMQAQTDLGMCIIFTPNAALISPYQRSSD